MRHPFRSIAFALLVAASACGSDVTAPPIAALVGNWSRVDEIPGSSERWSLALSGNTISGTGTWSGEACCSGPLSIAGTIAGDSIHLDVTMVVTIGNPTSDHHEHFDGALTSAAELRGIATLDAGASGVVRLRKLSDLGAAANRGTAP